MTHTHTRLAIVILGVIFLAAAGCYRVSGPPKKVFTGVSQVEGVAPDQAPQNGPRQPLPQVRPDLFTSAQPTVARRVVVEPNVVTQEYQLRPFEEWSEQEAAAEALGRIGPPAVPQLVEALHSNDAETRLVAAQTLARLGTDARDAVPDLIPLLEDPDERIRKAAMRALGRVGPEASEAVPALMKSLLEKEPAPR